MIGMRRGLIQIDHTASPARARLTVVVIVSISSSADSEAVENVRLAFGLFLNAVQQGVRPTGSPAMTGGRCRRIVMRVTVRVETADTGRDTAFLVWMWM